MTSSNASIARLFAWLCLAALIGVYLLYDWYSGHLKTQIADLEAGISQTASGLKDREGLIASLQRDVADLNEQTNTLVAQHASDLQQLEDTHTQTRQQLLDEHAAERQELEGRVATADQTISELEQALESLRENDAEALAAEQSKTEAALDERDRSVAAFEELQGQYDAAIAKSEQLEEDLINLRQVIVDSTLEHREQIEALERHLNERVQLAKATPKDDDLMRAAQAAGLLPEAMHWAESVTALAEQLAVSQAQIESLQGEADAARARHDAQIASLQDDLVEARTRLSEQPEEPQVTEQITALQARLAQADAELVQAQAAAAAELDAAKTSAAEALAAAEERVASLTEALEQSPTAEQIATLQARLTAAETRAEDLAEQLAEAPEAEQFASLQERLTASEAALEDARADLDRRVKAEEAEVAELSEQLAALMTEQEQITGEKARLIAEHKDAIARANSALQETQGELETLREELERARRGAADAGSQALEEAQAMVAALEAQLAEERAKSEGLMADLRREAEQAAGSVRALYQRFAELGGTHTERGMLLNLADTDLRFQTSMAILPETDLPSLDRIAELLNDHPQLQVRIEGYTDITGDEQANLALSLARAEAVQQALIERGVEATRLTAEGNGPARPIADNATAAGRAQNRRVEVYVIEG
ncbi:OmpA family protein [Thiocapsa imhoffii]|nr:OmpA family protein [Thiocapsa imhoffii]